MSDFPLPSAMAVRELLEGLIGRDIEVRTGGDHVDPSGPGGAVVALYVTARQQIAALAVVDLPLAAHLGASIALVPAGGAEAAIEDGVLPPALVDNVGEVLNVMASLFNLDGGAHLRLDATYPPGTELPVDVAAWVMAFVARLDLDVTVKGYGSGRLSLLTP